MVRDLGAAGVDGDAAGEAWSVVQWASFYVGWSNLIGGLLGFVAPLVFFNADQMVNLHPGKLVGLTSINMPHGLLHSALGVLGILAAYRSHGAALAATVLSAVLWGGLLAAYLILAGGGDEVVTICGMAVDNGATVVHLFWAGIALLLLAHPLFRDGGRVVTFFNQQLKD
jgi:hypothetical protein